MLHQLGVGGMDAREQDAAVALDRFGAQAIEAADAAVVGIGVAAVGVAHPSIDGAGNVGGDALELPGRARQRAMRALELARLVMDGEGRHQDEENEEAGADAVAQRMLAPGRQHVLAPEAHPHHQRKVRHDAVGDDALDAVERAPALISAGVGRMRTGPEQRHPARRIARPFERRLARHDGAIGVEQHHRAMRSELDRLVDAGEIGDVDGRADDAGEAAVGIVEAMRDGGQPFPRERREERRADEESEIAGVALCSELREFGDARSRWPIRVGRHLDLAFCVRPTQRDEKRRRLLETHERLVRRLGRGIAAGEQILANDLRLAESAVERLEAARGVLRQRFGVVAGGLLGIGDGDAVARVEVDEKDHHDQQNETKDAQRQRPARAPRRRQGNAAGWWRNHGHRGVAAVSWAAATPRKGSPVRGSPADIDLRRGELTTS